MARVFVPRRRPRPHPHDAIDGRPIASVSPDWIIAPLHSSQGRHPDRVASRTFNACHKDSRALSLSHRVVIAADDGGDGAVGAEQLDEALQLARQKLVLRPAVAELASGGGGGQWCGCGCGCGCVRGRSKQSRHRLRWFRRPSRRRRDEPDEPTRRAPSPARRGRYVETTALARLTPWCCCARNAQAKTTTRSAMSRRDDDSPCWP